MMLTTGLALGLATAGFTVQQIAEFRQSVNARVTSLADSLGANGAGALAFQDEDAAGRIVRSVEGQAYIVIACLYVPEGPLLAEYQRDSALACPADAEAFAGLGDSPLRHLSVVDYEGDSVGSVGLVADQEELFRNLRDYAVIATGLLFTALAAAWALAFFFQNLISEPLLHLVSVARTVTERRDYSMRAASTGEDEVGLLGRTFNEMLGQLETDGEERKRSTRNLKAARDKAEAASQAKSSFLATMSHEIRTPMNGITGMTTLLLRSPLNPGQRECVEVVQRSTDSLLQIINDILDFSKIEAGKVVMVKSAVDLERIIQDVVDLLHPTAREKGIDLLTLYPPGLPRRFLGDAGRLRQILVNLAGNAVKFTGSGHVLIKVDVARSDDSRGLVKICVEDSGPGIPEHLREMLFDKFARADNSTTRTEGGTGLGLAISRQLVELMGGTIQVDDAPGGGARFVATVPLGLDPTAGAGETTDELTHLRVLVLSAKEQSRAVLRAQLGPLVAVVDVASTLDQALALLKAASERQSPYQVVVAEGQPAAGEELAALVKADRALAGTVLVALTSTADPEDAFRLESAGFSACLVNPVTPSTLLDALSGVWQTRTEGGTGKMVTKGSLAEQRTLARGQAAVEPPPRPRYRVLVAEDNGVNQVVTTKLVEYLGGCVDIAPNGRDAVRRACSEEYDLVLMDCQMPELDGYEATAEIRRLEREFQHVPIVAMTANAMTGDRERCLAAGMDDYVTKPVKLSRLSRVVERWVRKEPATGSSNQEPASGGFGRGL
jgi:signal transduction histidine kinase/DNA-binding response OmpR family regulator